MDVKTLCLGALTMGDATGYEIRKMFEEGPFGQFYDASYYSIYPSLNALLREQLVSVTEHAQDGKPDKKVYRLTPSGLQRFKEALAEPPTRDKIRSEHVVRLFFADYLSRDNLEKVYASYLNHFQEQAARLRSLEPDPDATGRMFARGMGLRFYEQMAEYLMDNRELLFSDLNAPEPLRTQQNPTEQGSDHV